MHPFTYGQTVTLVRRAVSGTDEYGNDTFTETQEDIPLCVVAPTGGSELIQFTDQVNDPMQVWLPAGTDLTYLDAIIFEGLKYEVQGNPNSFTSPFSGHISPVQISVLRVSGAST
jgi:hypothetical protein